MKVIYANTGRETLLEQVEWILKRWPASVATDFLDKVEEVEKHLLRHPKMGQYDPNWKCRKFLIAPPVYMLYDVDGDVIYIKYFWNNRQKPLFD